RQAIQSPRRRQLRCGKQDGGATGFAFGGAGLVASRAGFFGRGSVHDLTIARTVVTIKVREKSTNVRICPAASTPRRCFVLGDTAPRGTPGRSGPFGVRPDAR